MIMDDREALILSWMNRALNAEENLDTTMAANVKLDARCRMLDERLFKAEAECERLKALCVGCLNIYYVVDPPFPADAMKNYLEEEGINLEHYTYKKEQP